ncbi:MAG: CinA family protein [Methylosarcina sp.]
MHDELLSMAAQLGNILGRHGLKLALAESCTGGWICQCITEIAGSSKWFDRGFVTYSNAAKIEMLGVDERTLQAFGAVSTETARNMAAGALRHSDADIALAVTGIAGPDGSTSEKPVGLVYLAWQRKGSDCRCIEQLFEGSRQQVRYQAVRKALRCLMDEFDIAAKSV